MLKAEQEREKDRNLIVKAEEGCSGAGFFHKWYARFEEHGIVVITDEAFPTALLVLFVKFAVGIDVLGGERPDESSESI